MKKCIILFGILIASFFNTNEANAQDPMLGEITIFAGNFAPRGWAFCDGQLLPIAQYQALFSLLGTTYGGDGRTTFGLPDLRGRLAINPGTGPGLRPWAWGQKFGNETETLTEAQIPGHSHSATTTTQVAVSTAAGEEGIGNGLYIASQIGAFNSAASDDSFLAGPTSTTTIGNTGGSQSHENMQPYTTVNFIIALVGVYPSRN
ncbi:phage tail protein [Hyunsoonleella rubra]|uniref:Phage tail protein n=1 Tax=Hyunsoonleella rubra TaxID=1737062 RepID=A0ABW5T6N8_9FLAO